MRFDGFSDADLLGATSSDPAAFGVFYRRHEDAVLRWCLRRTGEPELAADLAAEVFAAALVSSRRFRPGASPAEAWLFGIARNVLAMSRRRGQIDDRARRRLGMQPVQLTDAVLEAVIDASPDQPAVEALEDLPEEQQRAIRARVLDEREYADIAQELRCSEQVVRKRVSRGLAQLKVRMEDLP